MPDSSWDLTAILLACVGGLAYIIGKLHAYHQMSRALEEYKTLRNATRLLSDYMNLTGERSGCDYHES